MAALSIADVPANVTVGVDTHKHSHVALAKDGLGRHLGQLEVGTDLGGYADLLAWAHGFGPVVTFGIEGTSSYGAGLTRFLLAQGQAVIEVLRPVRRDRRFGSKSDPIDADAQSRRCRRGDGQSAQDREADCNQGANSSGERGEGSHRDGARPHS